MAKRIILGGILALSMLDPGGRCVKVQFQPSGEVASVLSQKPWNDRQGSQGSELQLRLVADVKIMGFSPGSSRAGKPVGKPQLDRASAAEAAEEILKWPDLRHAGRRALTKTLSFHTDSPLRILRIFAGMSEVLERRRRAVAQDFEWVFPDEDGGSRITYDRAVDRFQLACCQVQLPEGQFTDADGKPRQPAFHDLRRTFARVTLRSGRSESDVMLIAGWKTPVMLRRYLGSNEEGPPVLFSSRLEYLACEYPVSWRSEHAGANR